MKNWRKLAELIDRNTLDEYIKEEYKKTYGRTYDTDIYAYISDDETEVTFDDFINVGGNSWLDDDHFLLDTFKGGYYNIADEFNSNDEFVKYMIDCYNVEIPFDKFTDEDGDIDYVDCAKYILENYCDECDKALSDMVDESWDGTITDYIMDDIKAKAKEEEEEEE